MKGRVSGKAAAVEEDLSVDTSFEVDVAVDVGGTGTLASTPASLLPDPACPLAHLLASKTGNNLKISLSFKDDRLPVVKMERRLDQVDRGIRDGMRLYDEVEDEADQCGLELMDLEV